MGFTLIKGTYYLKLGHPDGDSMRFLADRPDLFDRLAGPPVGMKELGTVQLRYEGIDTVEKGAIQPLARDSLNRNLDLLRAVDHAGPAASSVRGFILSRLVDANRRPVCFVFAGASPHPDGARMPLVAEQLLQSVNYKLLSSGMAYTLFYETLASEIRCHLTAAFQQARAARVGLHQRDRTTAGVVIHGRQQLAKIPPIFPKLWRRLDSFFASHDSLAEFKDWLAANPHDNEQLSILSDRRRRFALEEIIAVQDDQIRLLHTPEDLLFHRSP
jgi:hypothetical protein